MTTPVVSICTLGISGTFEVVVNLGQLSPTEPRNTVSLTSEYIMLEPPGFISRQRAGVAENDIQLPGTFAAGATIECFDFEANAIVSVGGGIITGTLVP